MSPPDDRYELYRVITDMDALHEAFRDRVDDLDATRISVDDAGGFTPGYSAKILCQPPMKMIGRDSLPKILKATGMALVLVIDDQRFEEAKAKLIKRKKNLRAVARIKRVKGYFTKENAKKYGQKRWAGLTEAQRSKIAKRAIKARWKAARSRAKRSGTLLNSTVPTSSEHGQQTPSPRTSCCPPVGNQATLCP